MRKIILLVISMLVSFSIPIKYRRRGYELYQEALSDGHSQVDRLVSKYLSEH